MSSSIDELQAGLANLAARVEVLEDDPAGPAPTDPPADDIAPVFDSAEEWVTQWLVKVMRRRLGPTTRWCERWREHPEACWRLEGMWRSWELCRYDVWSGISTWVREHFDPSWAVLTGPEGTFRGCDKEGHVLQPELAAGPARSSSTRAAGAAA